MPAAPKPSGPINFSTGLNLAPPNTSGAYQLEKSNTPSGSEKIYYPPGMTPDPSLRYTSPVGGFNIANAPANSGASGLLAPDSRAKLDGIVQQMQENGESDDYIQGVVNDFKQKYAGTATITPPTFKQTVNATAQTAIGKVIEQAKAAFNYEQEGIGGLMDNSDLNAENVRNAQRGGGPLAGFGEATGQVANLLFHKATNAGKVVGGAIGQVISPITAATQAIGTPIGKAIASAIPDNAARAFNDTMNAHPEIGKYATDVLDLSNLALPKGAEAGAGLVKPAFTKLGEGARAVTPHPIDAIRGYANNSVKASIQRDVTGLLKATRSIGNKTLDAAKGGTNLHETLSDPQVFKGLKVKEGKINPDEAISVIDSRIDSLLDAKRDILPHVDKIVPTTPRSVIRSQAVAFIERGIGAKADKAAAIDRMDAQLNAYPEQLKPSDIDAMRADMRGSARDAKGLMKSDSEYAALEDASRKTVFDITDKLPVPNAPEYKALNDYVKKMITTKTFLDKTLRNQVVKGGRLRGYSLKLMGTIAGASHGPLGSMAGHVMGGLVADILTNNALGSSLKLSLIRNLNVEPAILSTAEKLLGDIQGVPQKLLPPGNPNTPINDGRPIIVGPKGPTEYVGKDTRIGDYRPLSQDKTIEPITQPKTIDATKNISDKVQSPVGSVKPKPKPTSGEAGFIKNPFASDGDMVKKLMDRGDNSLGAPDVLPESTYREYIQYPRKTIKVDDINGLDHRGLILDAEKAGRKVDTPILVDQNPDGSYQLVDGNHRMTQAMVNKDANIDAFIKPAPKSSGDDTAGIIGRHFKSAYQTLNELPRAKISENGGITAIKARIVNNIAGSLRAAGKTVEAGRIEGVKIDPLEPLDAFERRVYGLADLKPPTSGQAGFINWGGIAQGLSGIANKIPFPGNQVTYKREEPRFADMANPKANRLTKEGTPERLNQMTNKVVPKESATLYKFDSTGKGIEPVSDDFLASDKAPGTVISRRGHLSPGYYPSAYVILNTPPKYNDLGDVTRQMVLKDIYDKDNRYQDAAKNFPDPSKIPAVVYHASSGSNYVSDAKGDLVHRADYNDELKYHDGIYDSGVTDAKSKKEYEARMNKFYKDEDRPIPTDGKQSKIKNSSMMAAAATPSIDIKSRGVSVKEPELGTLRKVLFAEISNRTIDKQKLEARTIINTALNRMKQKGESLEDVITAPKQYQGYGSKEYERISSGKTTLNDSQKLKAIDAVIAELRTGNFKDNIDGDAFYTHKPDGRIEATSTF